MMLNGGVVDFVVDNLYKGFWLLFFVKVVFGEFDFLLLWLCKEKIWLIIID